MAILVAILQLNSISMLQTNTMVEARERAAEAAMADSPTFPLPGFLQTWEESTDGKRYTTDDKQINANSADFSASILNHAADTELEWSALTAKESYISTLCDEGLNPAIHFGLVSGSSDPATIELMKIFQSLIYNKPSITVESEVWMTWTKGIY